MTTESTTTPLSHGLHGTSIWETRFPLNTKTLLFCFFVGSLCSVPMGLLFNVYWKLVEPPLWTAPFYAGAVLISLVVLPFWSKCAVGDQPILKTMGLTVAAISIFCTLIDLLFPAL